MEVPKSVMSKKSKGDVEQTLAYLCSADRRSRAKCQLVQTSYIKPIKFLSVFHVINIVLTTLSLLVWKNLSDCVRSVRTRTVKLLPYRADRPGRPTKLG